MPNSSRKKAFTLTELLVVVVVVGILAAVSIPKFNQVLETRRTAEAEELIAAVRVEQEKRCTFDKPYAGSFDKMPGVISVNNPDKNKTRTSSQNYTYFLGNSGMYAASTKKDYQIKMQSYATGDLCCAGPYCDKLNKSYPLCGATPSDGCATEVAGCQNPIYFNKLENACECEPTGCRCGSFAAANPCVCAKECDAGKEITQSCGNCGEQKQVCNSSCQWSGVWSGCAEKCQCKVGALQKETCSSGKVRTRTFSISGWSGWTSC